MSAEMFVTFGLVMLSWAIFVRRHRGFGTSRFSTICPLCFTWCCTVHFCAMSSRIRHVRLQRLRDTFKVALMLLFCQCPFLCDVIEDLATRGLSCGHFGLQVGLKMASRWAQDGSKMPQHGHRSSQDGRKRPQDGFRMAPRCPNRLHDSPKVAPGGP